MKLYIFKWQKPSKIKKTLERELRPLKKLKDKYPCVLITLDNDFNQDYDGIKSINAIDFLQGKV